MPMSPDSSSARTSGIVVVDRSSSIRVATREHQHAPDAFRDEHPAVIGEGDVPWMLEALLHDLDTHRIQGPEPRQADACRDEECRHDDERELGCGHLIDPTSARGARDPGDDPHRG